MHHLGLGGLEDAERADITRALGEHHVARVEEEAGQQVERLLSLSEHRWGDGLPPELARLLPGAAAWELARPAVEAVASALPDRVLVYTDDGDAVSRALDAAGPRPLAVLARRSSLEDVFLRLTGRSLID